MICEDCEENKQDTKIRPDPYEQDLNGKIIWVCICDDCAALRADEL